MREEPELSISKKQADCAIRAVGFLGLVVVFFSLQSATVRPAGTRLSLPAGITPLIGVEVARSKADLEQFFGEPGSANRNLIAGRSAMPGVDFFSGWILFLFGLGELMPPFRPRMRAARFDIFVLLCFTAFFEYHNRRYGAGCGRLARYRRILQHNPGSIAHQMGAAVLQYDEVQQHISQNAAAAACRRRYPVCFISPWYRRDRLS